MQRTLQTLSRTLDDLMWRDVPVLVRAEWQENSTMPCDTGSPIEVMRPKWQQFDWSTVDKAYPSKEGYYEFSKEALLRRGAEARKWLRDRPEKVIAVITHAGFLRVAVCQRMFQNADYRIFDFVEGGDELVEWKATEEKGGGLGISPKGVFGFREEELERMDRDMRKKFQELELADEIPARDDGKLSNSE